MKTQWQPLVSVIIPSFNPDFKHFYQALKSIVFQSYKNLEIIVIDDGSNNGIIPLVLEKFRDNRINYIKNPKNLGISYSLNLAMKISNGKYIARMDSDDISSRTRIYNQVTYLEKNNNIAILGTSIRILNKFKKISFPNDDLNIRTSFLFRSPFAHPTIMFRKSFVEKLDYKIYSNKTKVEDYDAWVNISSDKNIKFANLKKVFLKYRIHNNQLTNKRDLILDSSSKVRSKYLSNCGIYLDTEAHKIYNNYINSKSLTFFEYKILKNILEYIYDNLEYSNLSKKYFSKLVSFKYYKDIFRVYINKRFDLLNMTYSTPYFINFFNKSFYSILLFIIRIII